MLIPTTFTRRTFDETEPVFREKQNLSFDRGQQPILDIFHRPQPSFSSGTGPNSSMTTLLDDREIRMIRGPTPEPSEAMTTLKHGIFKWPGHRMRDQTFASSDPRSKRHFEHNLRTLFGLRAVITAERSCGVDRISDARVSHLCRLRLRRVRLNCCLVCHINVHSRCVNQVHASCSQHPARPRDELNGIGQQGLSDGTSADDGLPLKLS